jgi:hypothetical protein
MYVQLHTLYLRVLQTFVYRSDKEKGAEAPKTLINQGFRSSPL